MPNLCILLSAAALGLMAAQAGAIAATSAPVGNPAAVGAPTRSNEATAIDVQHFSGSLLTEARAREIVDSAGFIYLGHKKCIPASRDCAVFDVQEGRDGRILYFQVASQNHGCLAAGIQSEPIRRRVAPGPQTAPLGQRFAAEELSTVGAETAAPCFGSFPIISRGIYNNSTTFAPNYAAARFSLTVQTIVNERWRDQASVTAGTVMQPHWPTYGQTAAEDSSYHYEIRDGRGAVLAADMVTTTSIPSSSGSLSLAQRCANVAAGVNRLQQQSNEVLSAVCPGLLPAVEAESTIIIGIKFSLNPCATAGNFYAASQGPLQQAIAAACQAAPQCFISGYGSCGVPAHGLPLIAGLAPLYFNWAESVGAATGGFHTGPNCPTRKKTTTSLAGTDCVETVTERCSEIGGACKCETTDVVTVCGGTVPDEPE